MGCEAAELLLLGKKKKPDHHQYALKEERESIQEEREKSKQEEREKNDAVEEEQDRQEVEVIEIEVEVEEEEAASSTPSLDYKCSQRSRRSGSSSHLDPGAKEFKPSLPLPSISSSPSPSPSPSLSPSLAMYEPRNLHPLLPSPGPPQLFFSHPLPSQQQYVYPSYPLPPPLPAYQPAPLLLPNAANSSLAPEYENSPSRSLRLIGVSPELPRDRLKEELSLWGDVCGLQFEDAGVVIVHYFDLRSAIAALTDIRRKPPSTRGVGLIGGKPVFAYYLPPIGPPALDSPNQGALVVSNLDADVVSNQLLRSTFERYGPVKEVRDVASKRQFKYVEFYDTRDAASALDALDGQVIGGSKNVKIEFGCPSAMLKRVDHHPPPFPNQLLPAGTMQGQQLVFVGCGYEAETRPPPMNYFWHGYSSTHPQPHPHAHPHHQPHPLMPPLFSHAMIQEQKLAHIIQETHQLPSPLQSGPSNSDANHSYGSSAATTRCSGRGRLVSTEGGLPRRRSVGPGNPRKGLNNRSCSSEGHMEGYKFNEVEAESNTQSARTTLMLRNIPNKYSLQMLLSLLDEHCIQVNSESKCSTDPVSSYDFLYLPMDFKNKCNLGYAFVNFTSAQATLKVHKAFDGRQWKEFNSRKICQVTYARVQGRTALEEHFRNSRFECDTEEYLPLVFSPPRTGAASDCSSPGGTVSPLETEEGENPKDDDGELGSSNERNLGSVFESRTLGNLSSSSPGRGNWTGIGVALGRCSNGQTRGVLQHRRYSRVK